MKETVFEVFLSSYLTTLLISPKAAYFLKSKQMSRVELTLTLTLTFTLLPPVL